jgi:TonB-linked SusC/RagA family outer membrane protein
MKKMILFARKSKVFHKEWNNGKRFDLCALGLFFAGILSMTASEGNNLPLDKHSCRAMTVMQKTVTGTVTDEAGTPLPGVSIIEAGTSNGVTSDFDGNYSIEVDADATLIFSYIGFSEQRVEIDGRPTIDVSLQESIEALDEVVVIGFGERRAKDLTGSIATVNAEAIGKVDAISPQYALQGNTAGVRVVNNSGDPNEAPQIFVRGVGTFNGDSQPLYVIDGQIFEPPRAGNEDQISGQGLNTPPNLFNLINPNDIESMTVLKDASAAAIYGNRGANGVILITTKKGKKGKPVVEFNTKSTFSSVPTYDILNTQQYVNLINEMFANNLNPDITIEDELYGRNEPTDANRLTNRSPQFDPQSPFYISDRTTYDWQDDLVKRGAYSQTYDAKVSGATENIDYYVSGGYLDQKQVLVGNDLERYTAAINVNADVAKWLKVGVNYKHTSQISELNNTFELPDFASNAPWQPLRDPDNRFGYAPVLAPLAYSDEWTRSKIYGQGSSDNILALNDLNYRDFQIDRNLGNAYVELKPLDGLSIKGTINLDYIRQKRTTLDAWSRSNIFKTDGDDPATEAPNAPGSLGELENRINNTLNYQADLTVTYSRIFGNKHSMNLTAAVQDQRHEREFQSLNGNNLLNLAENPRRNGYSNDLSNNSSIYGWDRRFWFGIVGRASYNYDSKYYIDLSARRDASSGFDDDFRWGNFYSVSGAWRISSENFMSGLEFIDDLKLRGGWGEAGNDQAAVGRFAFLSGVANVSSTRFGSGEGDPLGIQVLGSVVSDLPNPSLTWEVVTTTYAGFDALLLDNRLNITFEWYNRATDGILQTVTLPPSVAVNPPVFNIGKLENRGADIQAGYNDNLGDFNYGISGNLSLLKNEVVELFNDQPLNTQDFGRIEEGRSVGTIWGYKVGGIFQSQAEIDQYFSEFPDETIANTDFVAPGDLYFLDVQGNPTEDERFYSTTPDGVINAFDRTEIGNTVPGYTYGLNLNASWKGFDLTAGFYGEGDVDKYNFERRRLENLTGPGGNAMTTVLDRWTPQNTNTMIPRAVVGDPAGNTRFSDRYVESAAFFRLNNWQVGYSLPETLLDKWENTLSNLRFFVSGQNNIYRFSYSGIDPVNGEFPLPRSFSFGINARF